MITIINVKLFLATYTNQLKMLYTVPLDIESSTRNNREQILIGKIEVLNELLTFHGEPMKK